MNIKTLAEVLLTGQIFSAIFILLVLIRQISLFKLRVQPGLEWFRRILFLLALTIFAGNLVPILIDVLTIKTPGIRATTHTNVVGILYAASNTFVLTMSALLIWIMYRLAARTLVITEHEKEVALDTKAKEVQ